MEYRWVKLYDGGGGGVVGTREGGEKYKFKHTSREKKTEK